MSKQQIKNNLCLNMRFVIYRTNVLDKPNVVNNYIREAFADGVTHTVNMPINTTSSCKNMCGPPNRCSITGTECLSDIDCYGCQPNTSPDLSNTFLEKNKKISGYSQAGKLSFLAPDYSPLIHDIGTKSKPLQGDPYIDHPSYNWGFDEWTKKNINMRTVYDKRYEVPPKTVFSLLIHQDLRLQVNTWIRDLLLLTQLWFQKKFLNRK